MVEDGARHVRKESDDDEGEESDDDEVMDEVVESEDESDNAASKKCAARRDENDDSDKGKKNGGRLEEDGDDDDGGDDDEGNEDADDDTDDDDDDDDDDTSDHIPLTKHSADHMMPSETSRPDASERGEMQQGNAHRDRKSTPMKRRRPVSDDDEDDDDEEDDDDDDENDDDDEEIDEPREKAVANGEAEAQATGEEGAEHAYESKNAPASPKQSAGEPKGEQEIAQASDTKPKRTVRPPRRYAAEHVEEAAPAARRRPTAETNTNNEPYDADNDAASTVSLPRSPPPSPPPVPVQLEGIPELRARLASLPPEAIIVEAQRWQHEHIVQETATLKSQHVHLKRLMRRHSQRVRDRERIESDAVRVARKKVEGEWDHYRMPLGAYIPARPPADPVKYDLPPPLEP